MHFGIRSDAVHKVKNGVDEGMFVADYMAGRPPSPEIGVRGVRAEDGFEARFVGRITTIAIFQLVHALETETQSALAAVDLPAIVVFVPRRQACGLEGAIGAGRHAF